METINTILCKTKKKTAPAYFIDGPDKISDPKVIDDKFNKFFAEIGPKLANQIHSSLKFDEFLKTPYDKSFFFNTTSPRRHKPLYCETSCSLYCQLPHPYFQPLVVYKYFPVCLESCQTHSYL